MKATRNVAQPRWVPLNVARTLAIEALACCPHDAGCHPSDTVGCANRRKALAALRSLSPASQEGVSAVIALTEEESALLNYADFLKRVGPRGGKTKALRDFADAALRAENDRLKAAHPAPSPDGFRQCAEHGPWHVEDGICHGCAHPIPDAERREKHWREAAVAAIWRFNQERAEDDGWVQTQADQVVNGLRAHLASKPAPEAGECLECGQKPGTWEGCGTCDTGRGLEAHDLHACTPAPPAVCEACADPVYRPNPYKPHTCKPSGGK